MAPPPAPPAARERDPLRGRYAPSPTGGLHLGNARTALLAWWRARSTGSSFVLRVDDLDRARSREEAVAANLAELRWLGIDWDEGPDVGGPVGPYRQSERGARYEAALARLRAEGRTFECWLSRRDLREIASAPHGAAPVYGARERARNARAADAKRAEGKAPSVRVRAWPGALAFEDAVAGSVRLDAERDVGDVVARRADGEWAYHLATVVDDDAMGVREVVRGGDLLEATGAQLLLARALGLEPPRYAHVPLLLGPDGARLAKRGGALALAALRERGVRPERAVGLLAWTAGLLDERREAGAAELVEGFSFERLARAPGRVTEGDLAWLVEGA